MADNRWEPKAGAVAQSETHTVANTWATGDTITMTINKSDLIVTIGGTTTTAGVAVTMKEAWEGETFTDSTATVVPTGGGQDFPEHSEIEATVSGSVVTLTGETEGEPFTLDTIPDGTAGSGSIAKATVNSATGPNHADDIDNWSEGTIPEATASENVFVDNTSVSLLYGLDAFGNANDLLSWTFGANFTGDVGLPEKNANGYEEYRKTYLEMDTAILTIGTGDGVGSGRIKIDLGAVACAIVVEKTGSPTESGLGAVLIKGTSTSNTLTVHGGSVDLSAIGNEASAFATVRVVAGTVNFGSGVSTLTTLENLLGNVTVRTDVGTLTNFGGTVTVLDTAAITTLNVQVGTIIYNSTGIVTTANIGGGAGAAIVDCSGDGRSRQFTTTNLKANGTIIDPYRTITHSNLIAIGAPSTLGVSSISAL